MLMTVEKKIDINAYVEKFISQYVISSRIVNIFQKHFIEPSLDNIETSGNFETFQTKQLKMSLIIWFRGTPDCVRLNTNTHAYKYSEIRSSLTQRARRT